MGVSWTEMRGERNTEDTNRISINAQKKREAHTGESYGDRVSAARRRCFLRDQSPSVEVLSSDQ